MRFEINLMVMEKRRNCSGQLELPNCFLVAKRKRLAGHGKPRTFVLVNTRSFAWFLHPSIKLEAINTAFSIGCIVFWTGHCTYFQIGLFSPRSHSPRTITTTTISAHIKLFRLSPSSRHILLSEIPPFRKNLSEKSWIICEDAIHFHAE